MWWHKLKLGKGEQKAVDDSCWRIFIMRDFKKDMKIKKNSSVLYLVRIESGYLSLLYVGAHCSNYDIL